MITITIKKKASAAAGMFPAFLNGGEVLGIFHLGASDV
jgi:hypothetical protein